MQLGGRSFILLKMGCNHSADVINHITVFVMGTDKADVKNGTLNRIEYKCAFDRNLGLLDL